MAAFVQGVSTTASQTSTQTPNVTFATQNTGAGNMLVVGIQIFNNPAVTLSSVTDTEGGTWVVLAGVIQAPPAYNIYFAYKLGTTGGTKATITCHLSASASVSLMEIGEFSGVNTFRGAASVANATSTTPVSPSITTVIGDLLIGWIGLNQAEATANFTPGSGYTLGETAGSSGTVIFNAFEYDVSAPSTSATAAFGLAVNQTSGVGVAAFYQVFSISGNAGVAGATVSYSGTASGSVTADGSGNFTISGLANGTYTITPSKTGYTFAPPNRSETVSGSNITGVNFTATKAVTRSTRSK